MKILIIQTAFIGDVILATPILESLIRNHPDYEISVLVRKGNESLLNNFPGINKIYIWDKKQSKTKNLFNLIKTIRKEKYDEVVNVQRFFSTGLLTILSGAKIKTGFDKNPLSLFYNNRIAHKINDYEKLHEVERNLKLIKHHNGESYLRPILFPSKEDFDFISKYSKLPYITISPTSVWFTKQMPSERWVKLIQETEKANRGNYHIYVLGGPADKEACDEIIRLSGSTKAINLAGITSFLQTAALIKNATMNYVNDSAPMHIASAMNAPVMAIFCSTIPEFGFGPLSDNKKIIQIETKLDCRPCGLHGYRKCPKGHFRCGKEINIEKNIVKIV